MSLLLLLMLMMKQVLWGSTPNQKKQLASLSRLWPHQLFSDPKIIRGFQSQQQSESRRLIGTNPEVLQHAGTSFLMRFSGGNRTQTWHGREREKERDTSELCMACPCTYRASSNIDAFPSAIVLPQQKPDNHSQTLPSPHNRWSTPQLVEWTLKEASG